MSKESFSPLFKAFKKIKPLKTISFLFLYVFLAFWGGKALSHFFGSLSYVFTFLSPAAFLGFISSVNQVNIGKIFYKCWGDLSNKEHLLIIINTAIYWCLLLSIKETIRQLPSQQYERPGK